MEEKQKLIEEFNQKEQNLKNEINKLKTELNKYKNENENLKDKLTKANKILQSQQKNKINDSDMKKIKTLEDENKNLKEQLNLKIKEIKQIKLSNRKDEELVNINDIMVINFISTDSSVQCGIKCLPTYTFAKVEEELYQIYDDLRDTNNTFIVNGTPILRFKKINENNIHDGDKIQLIKVE